MKMKTDLSTKTVLVCASSLFANFSQRLARDFGKVYLCIPHAGAFPTMNKGMVGFGLDDIEIVHSVFGKHFDEVDLFCFPDLGNSALQVHLEGMGKRVFGNRNAEELEIYRELCKEVMAENGLPLQPWAVVKGVSKLREHLKAHKESHVKIDRWRGVTESFFSKSYDIIEPKINEVAAILGMFQDEIDFIVEDDLPDCVEVGTDAYVIDGKYPSKTLIGLEVKDLGYVGEMVKWDSIPDPIIRWNNAMAPILGEYGARGFISNEIRIGKDKVPYMIDATIRLPSPPSELYQELYTNISEIVWEGADGNMVDPVPAGKFGVELILKSDFAKTNFQRISFSDEWKDNIKLYNPVKIDGKLYCVPQDEDMGEVACVVGYGDKLEDAIAMAMEAADSVCGYGIKIPKGSIDSAKEGIEELEEYGISPFSVDLSESDD